MAETPKFSELIDYRIKFTTSDGTYEGVVIVVSNSFERMLLRHCVFLPDNIPVGILSLSFKEVSDVEVIGKSIYTGMGRRNILHVNGGTKFSEMSTQNFNIPPSFDNLPSRIFTIASIGEECKRAINDLNMSSVIGISLEGPMIGRFGLVHWLCASSRNCIYLFDLQRLGRKVFDLGLRKILESSTIEKVIHDCRQVSDALFHLYDTKLSKVFDTQTAEAFVNLQINSGDFNGNVNSLDICLQKHLNITEDCLPQPATNISYPQKVKSSLIRPTGHHELSIMIKNVIYLKSLREVLKKKILNPFRASVETYLNAVVSKSDIQLRNTPHDPTRIPGELIVDDKFRAVEFKERTHVPINESFNLPYTGQYSFVNKLNELRKQNPHSNANDIHSQLPKVITRRGPCHYPEPVCFLDAESRICSGKSTSDDLKSRSRLSISEGVLNPKKNMVLSGEKSMVDKIGTSKHIISSVSTVKKELTSGSKLVLKHLSALKNKDSQNVSSPKNNKLLLGERVLSSTETSKSSTLDDLLERKDLSGSKARIVLEYIRQRNAAKGRSNVNNSEESIPSEENHGLKDSSTNRFEKEGNTDQDSCDTSQHEMSDYNTVQYNKDGTFFYLPRKKVSSYDPSNPWAALKSSCYSEYDSVGCNFALKHKLVPAGAD